MEEKKRQPGEPVHEDRLSTGEEAVENTSGAAGEPSGNVPEQAGGPAGNEGSAQQPAQVEEKTETDAEHPEDRQPGSDDRKDRAFDTMELRLFDQLDTSVNADPSKPEDSAPSARAAEPTGEGPDRKEGEPGTSTDAAGEPENSPTQKDERDTVSESGKAPIASDQPAGEGSREAEVAAKPADDEPVADGGGDKASDQDHEPVAGEDGEKATGDGSGSAPAEGSKTERKESEPVAARKASEPDPASEKKDNREDTGVITAIKREIRNTPKPKKMLVGTIAVAMVLAGVAGFSAYADSSGVSLPEQKPQAQQPAKQPAKLMLTHSGQSFELDLYTMGYDGKNPDSIDQGKLRKWLDDVKDQVTVQPQNAKRKKITSQITPEKPGLKMDVKTVESWLLNLGALINKPTEIPMLEVEPSVTAADLQQVDQKLIGKYTTRFDPGNVNRTTNIKLASKAIDGLILMPGEVFSFNKVVGPRTAARGYKPAPVIVKGEYSEGIGGGICQVSSTLYNSVDEANLRIVQRRSHSKEVTYVPPGRDATVSWGGPDFKFKNNLNKPVLIRIKISGSRLTVYTYTVPGAKVARKKVPEAPESFSTIQVDPNKPTDDLPKSEQ
ncbi:VanW family protein [Staphylospora marina]|uniref:VanW family protein n=1 Tax=Staphylospora marina TaxID=2490858 RepID=UPI001F14FAE1|nr:VanW family protein [Staphylospora marina]